MLTSKTGCNENSCKTSEPAHKRGSFNVPIFCTDKFVGPIGTEIYSYT